MSKETSEIVNPASQFIYITQYTSSAVEAKSIIMTLVMIKQ